MMKKKILTIFFGMSLTLVASAQQAAQYSLYMLNPYAINPAYAGLDNSLSITGGARKQWTGLPGSPSTQNINGHLPISYLSGGFGINIENDVLGALHNTTASLSYSFHKPIGESTILAIGGSASMYQSQIDGGLLRTPDGSYSNGTVDHKDDFLSSNKQSATTSLLNGAVFVKNDRYEIGLTANNLLGSDVAYKTNRDFFVRLNRNYFLTFATNLEFGKGFALKPSILVKTDLKQTQIDFSTILKYNNNIFLGASYRGFSNNSTDALVVLAGIKLTDKIRIFYAYDIGLSKLNTVNNGSHEILFNYNLNKIIGGGVPEKIIYNPRFL